MDSEKVLLDMFKKRHYDESRHKMQKIIMTMSAVASAAGAALMSAFHPGLVYVLAFAISAVFASAILLLSGLKIIPLNMSSFIFMFYAGFILIPVFWHLTGIDGSAPYVSLVILVGMLSMFSGNMLKGMLAAYLALLLTLIGVSAWIEIPLSEDVPALSYTIVAYTLSIILITTYILSKLKRFEQMNDRFLQSSFKDDLTRVYNRKLLDIIIQYEETMYKKEHRDYILVMFDVDRFKRMNDEHGHIFGDIILRNVAQCISDKVRSNDFVVRYGGDEFLVVQTSATKDSLIAFTDRINDAIDASCYMDIAVSVSYGLAMRSEGETPDEVLRLADERLYKMKEAHGSTER